MSKIKIAKAVSLVLGIGIIYCTYLIFVTALGKKIKTEQSSEKAVLTISENAEISGYTVNGDKIYVLVKSSDRDSLIVIDENSKKEILKINVKKEHKNE